MRAAWLLALVAGCGFRSPAGGDDGGVDAPPVIDDAGREIVTWTLDTAADFTRPGAVLGDTGVETWGSVTSGAYLPGGVVVRGVASALWNSGQTDAQLTWDPVATATIAGAGVGRSTDLDSFNGFAQYGITGNGPFSLIVEGELLLDQAGQHGFSVIADNVAFLDIASPGTESFQRVVAARPGSTTPGAYDAPTAGWYPFRIGFSRGGGAAQPQLRVRHSGVGSGSFAPFDRGHLRGRGDRHRGLHRSVYNGEIMATSREVVGIDQRAFLAMSDFSADRLPGMPSPGTDNWSARWSGQFYAAVAGAYRIAVTSDNGNQITFADQRDADHWSQLDNGQPANTDVTATLAVGWHPIIVDYNEVTGGNTMKVLVKSSPDANLVDDQPIPLDRLRPVETLERAIAGFDGNDDDITSGGSAAGESIVFAGFSGETITAIEVSASLSGPHFEDFVFDLVRPDGNVLQLPPPGLTGNRDQTVWFHVTTPAFLTGATVGGTWALRVRDTDNGGGHTGDGQLKALYVTLHTTAGHPTVADDAFWTSQVIDLEARPLLDVTKVTWQGRMSGAATAIEIQMRACGAADCTGEMWSDAIPSGEAPVLTAGRRYLQARARLKSDGTHETELEQLQIVFRRPAM